MPPASRATLSRFLVLRAHPEIPHGQSSQTLLRCGNIVNGRINERTEVSIIVADHNL